MTDSIITIDTAEQVQALKANYEPSEDMNNHMTRSDMREMIFSTVLNEIKTAREQLNIAICKLKDKEDLRTEITVTSVLLAQAAYQIADLTGLDAVEPEACPCNKCQKKVVVEEKVKTKTVKKAPVEESESESESETESESESESEAESEKELKKAAKPKKIAKPRPEIKAKKAASKKPSKPKGKKLKKDEFPHLEPFGKKSE